MGGEWEVRVPKASARARLDAFLGSEGPFPSRSAAVKAIEDGGVSVNGEAEASKKRVLLEGDLVAARVPDGPVGPAAVEPERIPLDIRFEDEHLIVLSKQRGLVCHPAPGHETHTLANALVEHCGPGHLGTLQGEDRPGIVHRLDMDTTGLMLAAKDDETQAALQDAIRLRSVDRRYLALVHGYIAPDTGLIDAPIARSSRDRLKMAVSDDPGARQSVTTFTVLERFEAGPRDEGYTLIECKLFTGRTHQIRVHMAYIHHPVVGDQLYGRAAQPADLGLDRQFLHSWSLRFAHPATGQAMEFEDPPTWELMEALESIGQTSMGRTPRGREVMERVLREASLRDLGW